MVELPAFRVVVLVFLGGGLGSAARFLMQAWALRAFGAMFPVGTLAVNVLGSLVMGVVSQAAPEPWRVALATGVLGGFTTYSAFNQETLGHFHRGEWARACFYVTATVLGCLGAGIAGHLAARTVLAPR